MGPLISAKQRERVEGYVERALRDGANILIGGKRADQIVGGSGRSILIGGGGPDTVTGGSGSDILIGDSTAFDDAFREYVRRWAFKHPQPADFFRTMNAALGEDLSWFWRGWFLRSDHLDQAVDSVVQRDSAGQTLTGVFLSNRLEMVAPVELLVRFADGSTRTVKLPVETWLRGPRTVWGLRTPTAAKPVRIDIDLRGVYPDVDRSNNVWAAGAASGPGR